MNFQNEQNNQNIDDQDEYLMKQIPNYSRYLPIANINRIMKKALPENAKIAKDAKETVQECVSDFITSEACEKCKNEKRKTINGEDLLYATNTLGFENYIDILKLYLNKYREAVKSTENNPNRGGSKKERKEEDDDEDEDEDDVDEDEEEEI